MKFNNQKPIYIQIADTIEEKILRGEWAVSSRIPSVREYGTQLGVNPNTIIRTYEYLQREGMIYNKRGIGYFVLEGAQIKVREEMQNKFFNEDLKELFYKMDMLDITITDIDKYYKIFNQKNNE